MDYKSSIYLTTVSISHQRATEAFAACCNVATAAEQLANIADGQPELENLARDLANTATVIEILAHAIQDGKL